MRQPTPTTRQRQRQLTSVPNPPDIPQPRAASTHSQVEAARPPHHGHGPASSIASRIARLRTRDSEPARSHTEPCWRRYVAKRDKALREAEHRPCRAPCDVREHAPCVRFHAVPDADSWRRDPPCRRGCEPLFRGIRSTNASDERSASNPALHLPLTSRDARYRVSGNTVEGRQSCHAGSQRSW
jgi:hypothetical protein